MMHGQKNIKLWSDCVKSVGSIATENFLRHTVSRRQAVT